MADHAHKRAGINKTLGAEEVARDAEKGWIRMRYLASPDFENGRGVVHVWTAPVLQGID